MKSPEITKIERVSAIKNLPEGEYVASWSGYQITIPLQTENWILHTKDGIRGMAPVLITVSEDGKMNIEINGVPKFPKKQTERMTKEEILKDTISALEIELANQMKERQEIVNDLRLFDTTECFISRVCRKAATIIEQQAREAEDMKAFLRGRDSLVEQQTKRIDTLSKEVEGLKAKMTGDRDAIMPGAWECPKCSFVCQKNVLHAGDGSMSADTSPLNEICPNDGQLMKPLTWRKANEGWAECCGNLRHQLSTVTAERDALREKLDERAESSEKQIE